jgi:antitoxin (DNA-binding transcriptional repressor) of toxin-antitoxin stability system
MPSVNIRQLRDTRQLLGWLEAGEVVELRKRNIVVARIVPESPKIEQSKRPVKWPDFAARRRAIFGDRQINAVEILIEEGNSRY